MQRCTTCPHYVPAICDDRYGGDPRRAGCCVDAAAPTAIPGFADLFERHQRHVVAWACRMTGNYEVAKDLAQDVFLKAWVGIDRFRGDARFTTWLYTVTRNCCRDYLRARAARPREVGDAVLASAPPLAHNEGVAAIEAEQAAALIRRLIRAARLERIETRALTLHFAYDVPLQVVTARLGLTNPTGARALIVNAKRKLRAVITTRRWAGTARTARAMHAG